MSNPPIDPAAIVIGAPQAISAQQPPPQFSVRGASVGRDLILGILTRIGAVTILVMLAALVAVLAYSAVPSIRTFGLHFLVSRDWRPNELEVPKTGPNGKVVIEDGEVVTETLPPSFGALPVIYGTSVSSLVALFFAIPLSLGAAIFLVRIAPGFLVPAVSFLVEFLAAIPSIAYGIWGLFVMTPFLQQHLEPWLRAVFGHVPGFGWMFYNSFVINGKTVIQPIGLTGRDMLAGGMVLAIMIVPIITAISRDVLRQVPRAQVEGTVALGATWWQSTKEMLKFARTGLFGAIMLGLARAAGETMAITMVIGNNNQIKGSLFAPAQTMSSLLANEFAEASTDLHRSALCEVALVLLVMSLLFNVIARYLVVGKSETRGAAAF